MLAGIVSIILLLLSFACWSQVRYVLMENFKKKKKIIYDDDKADAKFRHVFFI